MGGTKKSHPYEDLQESNSPCVTLRNFEIIGSNFRIQKYKRKTVESLLIKGTLMQI